MDHGYDLVNLDRARDLVAGRPLATLPPEAFETPSTKGRSAPVEDDDDPALDDAAEGADRRADPPG
jgi:hypothetical protein